jgi:hypothetical protein
MSDYLSNLVMRSAGAGTASNVLHPRLPSLFETPNIEGQFPNVTSPNTLEPPIEPSQTIFSPLERASSIRAPQMEVSNPTQSLAIHLKPTKHDGDPLVGEQRKQLELAPSQSKLNPLPMSTSLPSVLTQLNHAEKRESIIQVHIGRVEVRAVTSSTPTNSKKTGSSSPKLTLDEYLRQRNEGKR